MALFTLLSDLSSRQFFIHTQITADQYIRNFESRQLFGRQLSLTWEYAGSEPYERTHITELPCFLVRSLYSKVC